MARRALQAWRSGASGEFRERMHAELESRWADGAAREGAKAAAVIARLEAELAASRAALAREAAARNEAEERFKQAFMRGVCALNFEALAVLKTGAAGPAAAAAAEMQARMSPMPVHL